MFKPKIVKRNTSYGSNTPSLENRKKMVVPILEVVLTNIGDHTIEDLNTHDGKEWFGAFVVAATQIPGLVRAGWGQAYEDREVAMHFIDYETRRQHDLHKANDLGGPIAHPHRPIMNAEKTDLFVIRPSTNRRDAIYAPHTQVLFVYGIDEDAFAQKAPEYFTAIANSDSCVGYIWGEIEPPILSNKTGNASLGRSGIMISGWKSREQYQHDIGQKRVVDAYAGIGKAAKKMLLYTTQINMMEKAGYFHKWRRMFDIDRSAILPAPGLHSLQA